MQQEKGERRAEGGFAERKNLKVRQLRPGRRDLNRDGVQKRGYCACSLSADEEGYDIEC